MFAPCVPPHPETGQKTPMKQSLFLAALLAALLAGCNQDAAPASQAGEPAVADDASMDGAPAAAADEVEDATKPKIDVAAIQASGKTGIWAEPAAVCAKGTKGGILIAWNVQSSGLDKVAVNLIGKQGEEKNFAGGRAVDGARTGRWVRPGQVFKVSNPATGEELGSVTIEESAC